jgi:hypothetical protein
MTNDRRHNVALGQTEEQTTTSERAAGTNLITAVRGTRWGGMPPTSEPPRCPDGWPSYIPCET